MNGRSFVISQSDAEEIAEALGNRDQASINLTTDAKFLTANLRTIAFVERAAVGQDESPDEELQEKIFLADGRSFPVSTHDADDVARSLQLEACSTDFTTTGAKLITANGAAIAFVERASLPEGDFDEEASDIEFEVEEEP